MFMYIRCIINILTVIDVHCITIAKIDDRIVFVKSGKKLFIYLVEIIFNYTLKI